MIQKNQRDQAMTKKTKNLGNKGEELAVKYLKNKKYQILDRNYRSRYAEADIIASNGDYIVLVEVKTKISFDQGSPEEMVNIHKQKKLRLLARDLMQKYPDENIRVDIVAIDYSNNVPKINHIINALEE